MQSLTDFDPIDFLEINTTRLNEKQIIQLRTFLNTKIGEYILYDVSQRLTDEQMKLISSEQDIKLILQKLKAIIPDFDQYFVSKLSGFKNDYQNTL